MARARGLTEGDEAVWALFASRVRALPGRRVVVASPEVAPSEAVAPRKPRAAEPATPPPTRRAPLGIGGQPPGVDTATWQRFSRGNLNSVRKLDLHGMTAQHAFAA